MIELLKGSLWSVMAWSENDECPTLDFLEELEKAGNSDVDKLNELITIAAEHGPQNIRNTEKCNSLEDGIFEFKASNGSRLFWFYGTPHRVVICTHGVKKPQGHGKKPYKPEIAKAKAIRLKYFSKG
ncbi:MAG TPA: type II toxin-antitoxin system RelE/ParE family toxin [Abditibacteriaceae bacterium]|jgi:hypothetical protein